MGNRNKWGVEKDEVVREERREEKPEGRNFRSLLDFKFFIKDGKEDVT